MAPKRPAPVEEPPTKPSASEEKEAASDEENEEVEEGESEEESEEEVEQPQPKQQLKKASSPQLSDPSVEKKPTKKPEAKPESSSSDDGSDSDSGSGSGSESESDSVRTPRSSGVDEVNVKPLASKPMVVESKAKKSRSDSKAAVVVPTKSAVKRQVENNGEEKNSKRAKKKVEEAEIEEKKSGGGDSKKQMFQRLWSEDDEIVILQGMIEYSLKTGAVPAADLAGFHDFIRKKLLHFDFTRAQLIDKIRRLKKKFDNNVGKGRKGEDKTFPKPHEQKAFDLSKKLWGKEARNNKVAAAADQAKSNGKSAKKVTQAEKEQFLAKLIKAKDTPPPSSKMNVEQTSNISQYLIDSTGFNELNESFVKEGMNRIGSAKKFELGERWRKLHIAETENFLTRLELIREQTKLVLDSFKASGY